MERTRWILADQLGDHFDDGGPMLLIESRGLLARRPYHRAKAHLILSGIRHRARALGDRVEFHQVDHYREVVEGRDDLEVIDPTSRGLRRLVAEIGAEVLPSRGFVTSEQEFAEWMAGRTSNRLVMEDFYRWSRARTGILMDGDDPVGGRWNYDHDNRERPPKGATSLGLPEPWWPEEDDIDAEVRADLDEWERKGIVRFVGRTARGASPSRPRRGASRSTTSWPAASTTSAPSRTRRSWGTGPWRTRS
ncbi:Deoxyribodipyrimidine photo-lyase-related protein [Clavibacter michiganensis subsp. michiganensis]|uniref:Deoxyribodipyrimidine photo-lyase-related protein n=1 Tax=Clavibacter michiganensis subsp. michiganensis TaxID=33013 RepID=A0A251XG57_CLAMM|nr:Deoxyribodipyrimidine photo-lyase-related protein [Clavibacter michiganensis subsp. michiganensis]OUE01390.1 Deoxyribodipyrimidine photo-lyase-related protein [Clavibacter michiganensis subsp. michiganensis]